tara:strand:+ start:14187 stop:14789 length:603 start_codon:yes stop_codon:yes gene_type:complete
MNDLVLIGGGGHARSCIDVIESSEEYRIKAIVDSKADKKNYPYEVYENEIAVDELLKISKNVHIAIGQIDSSKTRTELFELYKINGFNFPIIRSYSSHQSKYSKIGEGTVLMHHTLVNHGAFVGLNCIINNKVLVEHDCSIGDHCHIATGAILNGAVRVGDGSFIGSNAVVTPGVVIGKRCFIGSGVRVSEDLKDNQRIT